MACLMNAFKKSRSIAIAVCLSSALTIISGCQNGPMLGRMQQYQLENERLLSEFRSQKKEVEQLRADRTRLLQQQAETEKLAAKLQSQLSNGNAFASQNKTGRTDVGTGATRTPNELSSFDRNRTNDRLPSSPSLSKPDSSSPRSALNADSFKWGPRPKETR